MNIQIRHPDGKIINLEDAVGRRVLRRRYHPIHNAAIMINNALTLYQHKALDVTTTLDVIEDQVTFVCSIFEKDRRKGDDLRQPTKVKYNSLHNIAISIGNLIVWCQQDGSLDAPTAIALICEYNLTLLSCFEYHPQERK